VSTKAAKSATPSKPAPGAGAAAAAHTLIMASAGSGKTHTLTGHYLKVLLESLALREPPEHLVEGIFAATFTRAAAGEIVDRILRRLAVAVIKPAERESLCASLGLGSLSEDQCGAALAVLARSLDRLRVGTLDAFLIRSAACFAPELGLSHPWQILDDPDDALFRRRAAERVLEQHALDPGKFDSMLVLLTKLSNNRFKLTVCDTLLRHLNQCYEALGAGPDSAWEHVQPNPDVMLDDASLNATAASLRDDIDPYIPVSKGKQNGHWVNGIDRLCELFGHRDWANSLNSRFIASVDEPSPAYQRHPIPDELLDLLRPLALHAHAATIHELYERNLSTRTLLKAFDTIYRREKTRAGAWRFDDFTRLLVDSGQVEQLDEFFFRLDGRISHLLLDEFQDTSVTQWLMLRPIAAEILSGEGSDEGRKRRTLLCVGDVKQTLYGWRNAEPELIDTVRDLWREQLAVKDLTESFRSAPVIIDTVNRVFQHLHECPLFAADADDKQKGHIADVAGTWSRWFKAHTSARSTPRTGFARLHACEDARKLDSRGKDAPDTPKLRLNAVRKAADLVEQLVKAEPDATVAVLFRRKAFIPHLLKMLKDRGVNASGEGGKPLTDDPAVCAALSMLHLIDHPSDTAALRHVGESPLGAVVGLAPKAVAADVLKVTRKLHQRAIDLGLAAVLNEWLIEIAPQCDGRNWGRFRQLVELAQQAPPDETGFGPFVERVRATQVQEQASARVLAMTIHASKGRQFDFVVLPDLDDRLDKSGQRPLIRRKGLFDEADCISVAPTKDVCGRHPALAEMRRKARAKGLIGELCAMYVAMTRPKRGLDLVVHPQAQKNDAHKFTAAGLLLTTFDVPDAQPARELWKHDESVVPGGAADAGGKASSGPDGMGDPAPASPPAEVPPLTLVAPPPGGSRHRPQVSPSGLEGAGFVNLAGLLRFETRDASLDRGTVLHRWFEQVLWLDDAAPDDDALLAAVRDLGLPEAQVATLLPEFRRACGGGNVKAALCRPADAAGSIEVWRERNFALPTDVDGKPVLLTGAIDRVVVCRDASGTVTTAEVLDYKTDRVGGKPDVLADRVKHYTPQLRAYRNAVSLLLRVPAERVTAKLLFVEADAVVPVT
jgi:ATP-dependent exoDNAse (exonuclease V) beta subunit